jgi:hypothetical protein
MGVSITVSDIKDDKAYKNSIIEEFNNKYKWCISSDNTFGCVFRESSYRFDNETSALKDGLINYLENIKSNPKELKITWKDNIINID